MPLIGAGTGGTREARAENLIRSTLEGIDFDGSVQIVRFRGSVHVATGGVLHRRAGGLLSRRDLAVVLGRAGARR